MMRSDYRRILWYEFCGDQLVVGITSETPLHFILLYKGYSVGQLHRYLYCFRENNSMSDNLKKHCEVMTNTSRQHEQMPDGMVEWDPFPHVKYNPE